MTFDPFSWNQGHLMILHVKRSSKRQAPEGCVPDVIECHVIDVEILKVYGTSDVTHTDFCIG